MKKITHFLSYSFLLGISSVSAATIAVVVSPAGTSQVAGSTSGEPLYGTIGGGAVISSVSNSPGVIDDSTTEESPSAGAVTYMITFTDLPTWGTISFDLTVTPNAGGGLLYNGSASRFWTVDTITGTGIASTEQQDESRIHEGESITFSVSNLVSADGHDLTFEGFTGVTFSQQGTFDTATGVVTGVGGSGETGGRVNNLAFNLGVTPVPEPSAAALLALGGLALLRRRRR